MLVMCEETHEEYLNGKKEFDLVVGKYLFSLFLKKDSSKASWGDINTLFSPYEDEFCNRKSVLNVEEDTLFSINS